MTVRTCAHCERTERSGGLCGLHQRRRTLGEPMTQPHDLVGVAASGYGLLGIVERDETAVLCHECGRWLGALSWHIARTHGMTVADYRRVHGLPATEPLVSLAASESLSRAASERVGGESWQRFAAARDAALPVSQAMATAASRSAAVGTRAIRAQQASQRFAGKGERRMDEARWDARLAAYVMHWQTHGTPPRQHAPDGDERSLASWMAHQWRVEAAGKLSERRRLAIRDAGIPLDADATRGRRWRNQPTRGTQS